MHSRPAPSAHRPKVLVLGATGMLGHAVLRFLMNSDGVEVMGCARSPAAYDLAPDIRARIRKGVDVERFDTVIEAFAAIQPTIVINCVGVVKQLIGAEDTLNVLEINALLPHRLANLCAAVGARLVHVSTDCVFSGERGMYSDADIPDAWDLYGRSKLLGEVDYPHAVTLRTSIIGHELGEPHGLVGWFLAQTGSVKGYRRAIFSGVPTVELARIIRDFVIPDASLHGVYNVAAEPIAKSDLLARIASAYGKEIAIVPDDTVVIDRSLDAARFRGATGYVAPSWDVLIERMRNFQ